MPEPDVTSDLVLVGHRGYPARYPENSLAGMKAALDEGAPAVECDIQFSRDGVPMVIHDSGLQRTAADPRQVGHLTAEELGRVSIHEPARLGNDVAPEPVPTLRQLVALVQSYGGMRLFVEIKAESFQLFDREHCVAQVLAETAPLGQRVVVISYDFDTLTHAKDRGAAVGWVLKRYHEVSREQAETLVPDYLISNVHKLPSAPAPLWQGKWQWFVYDIVDWEEVLVCLERGIHYIETWDVGAVLAARKRYLEERGGA